MKIITLVSLVLILILINYLFRRGIRHIKKRNYLLDYIKRYLPVLEMLGWSVIIVWIIWMCIKFIYFFSTIATVNRLMQTRSSFSLLILISQTWVFFPI